jgi:hypothetical protein
MEPKDSMDHKVSMDLKTLMAHKTLMDHKLLIILEIYKLNKKIWFKLSTNKNINNKWTFPDKWLNKTLNCKTLLKLKNNVILKVNKTL